MKRLMTPKGLLITLLFFGALVIVFFLGYMAVNPGGTTLEATEGDAKIYVHANRRLVNAAGDCIEVHWEVENIKAILFNGEPTVGVESTKMCMNGHAQPTWHIIFADDTSKDYRLHIGILIAEPVTWLLAVAALALFFTGGYLVTHLPKDEKSAGFDVVRSILKALALFAFGTLLTLIMLEVGLRIYFSAVGSEEDRLLYVYSAEEIQNRTGRFVGLPYVGYGPSPDYPEHNSFGYRGPEITIPKPDGVFRIVTLGASTTYGFGVKSEESYPAQLQKILREEYGYTNVEVINGGTMGYTTWETFINLSYRAIELEPDLIILYQGSNDAEVRMTSPGCYNDVSPLRGLTTFHGLWKTKFDQVSPSVLYRYIAINLGWMKNPTALEFAFDDPAVEADCIEDSPVDPEEALALNPPVYFERNLHNMIAVAQANGIEVMLSRFIYPTSDIVDFALPDYHHAAIEEHNAITARLAEDMGMHYYDLAQDYVSEAKDWWSGVHMTPDGTHQQASLYAAYLVSEGLLPDIDTGSTD